MNDPETNNIINELVNKFSILFKPEEIMEKVIPEIRKSYIVGLENIEEQLDMNFLIDEDRLNFLQNYIFDNIKDLTDDLRNGLRQEISRNILNLESIENLKEKIQNLLDVTETRARTIARTETARAENMGNIDGARQSGFPLQKKVIGYIDKVTSPICRALIGTQIPIDEKFTYVDKKGITLEWDAPPFHPNCRSGLAFEVVIPKK